MREVTKPSDITGNGEYVILHYTSYYRADPYDNERSGYSVPCTKMYVFDTIGELHDWIKENGNKLNFTVLSINLIPYKLNVELKLG